MAILTREQILQADDLPKETVPVPEWGGEVVVKTLTAFERDEYEKVFLMERGGSKEDRLKGLKCRLVALSVVDESDAPVFTLADVEALGAKSSRALNRVFSAAQRLSGLTPDDVDELTKN